MYFFYSMVLALAALLGAPWWIWAMLRQGKYRAGLGERLGRVPRRLGETPPRQGCVWLHAVSVGEVLAISGLVKELQRRFPERRVVISTTTATGQKLARARFGETNVFFFPLDFAFAVRRYLQALQPELIVIAETEFWPNFLRLARSSGSRVAVVNARISDRSFPRYRGLRVLTRRILRHVDLFLAQTQEDARRLREIGAPVERIGVAGNLKFDISVPAEPVIVAQLRLALRQSQGAPVVVAGSTVEGEEELVLEAFRNLLRTHPQSVLVLAPRHPERFHAVAGLLSSSGLSCWRRSQWNQTAPVAGGVFLLDSIGELGAIYALADLAFVGGSLAPRGGHNILEPAVHGVPVLVGPYTENFRDIVALFHSAGALGVVADGKALAEELTRLSANPEERQALADRGAGVLRQHAGATLRTAAELEQLLGARSRSRPEAVLP
jgi:3-deoxy-D-manno-octulosonic-acid transferase